MDRRVEDRPRYFSAEKPLPRDRRERLRPKLEEIAHEEWEHIVYSMQRTLNKILHKPAKVGKEKAKNSGGFQYVETIKHLFGIQHKKEDSKK